MKAIFTPIRGILVKCTVRVRGIILESDAFTLAILSKNEGHLIFTSSLVCGYIISRIMADGRKAVLSFQQSLDDQTLLQYLPDLAAQQNLT